jgi:hypothetical protein
MHQLKLVRPLAGLLMAGQALAHKASHATNTVPASTRPTLQQSGSIPAALLDRVGGRGVRATTGLPAAAAAEATGKNHRYTLSH